MGKPGSPPQVRGKLAVSGFFTAPDGITPAGAGKTSVIIYEYIRGWDHPRRCGENSAAYRRRAVDEGSPPQVRGKLNPNVRSKIPVRITPAGAGKTLQARR